VELLAVKISGCHPLYQALQKLETLKLSPRVGIPLPPAKCCISVREEKNSAPLSKSLIYQSSTGQVLNSTSDRYATGFETCYQTIFGWQLTSNRQCFIGNISVHAALRSGLRAGAQIPTTGHPAFIASCSKCIFDHFSISSVTICDGLSWCDPQGFPSKNRAVLDISTDPLKTTAVQGTYL
jgi:hypothetical protein